MPVPSASATSQFSKWPRERPVMWMPCPAVRAVEQRRSSGSVPAASAMPWPVVALTTQSSSTTRASELMYTPMAVSRTAVRTSRVVERSSRATAGLSVTEISQSSKVPRASPLAQMPLPRASRRTQLRSSGLARSPTTTAEVPRCSMTQSSITLVPVEVSTMPAPAGLVTRQSRIASEPCWRVRTAVQDAPTTSQSDSAACPRGTSTAGSSSSWPCTTRPVSWTASATTWTTQPRRAVIRTLPRGSSAVMVTILVMTRFSS